MPQAVGAGLGPLGLDDLETVNDHGGYATGSSRCPIADRAWRTDEILRSRPNRWRWGTASKPGGEAGKGSRIATSTRAHGRDRRGTARLRLELNENFLATSAAKAQAPGADASAPTELIGRRKKRKVDVGTADQESRASSETGQ